MMENPWKAGALVGIAAGVLIAGGVLLAGGTIEAGALTPVLSAGGSILSNLGTFLIRKLTSGALIAGLRGAGGYLISDVVMYILTGDSSFIQPKKLLIDGIIGFLAGVYLPAPIKNGPLGTKLVKNFIYPGMAPVIASWLNGERNIYNLGMVFSINGIFAALTALKINSNATFKPGPIPRLYKLKNFFGKYAVLQYARAVIDGSVNTLGEWYQKIIQGYKDYFNNK